MNYFLHFTHTRWKYDPTWEIEFSTCFLAITTQTLLVHGRYDLYHVFCKLVQCAKLSCARNIYCLPLWLMQSSLVQKIITFRPLLQYIVYVYTRQMLYVSLTCTTYQLYLYAGNWKNFLISDLKSTPQSNLTRTTFVKKWIPISEQHMDTYTRYPRHVCALTHAKCL